jgi:hypothetical protein
MWVLIDRKWRFVFLVAIALIISIGYEAVALHKEVPSTLPGLIYQLIASIFSAIGSTALLVGFLGPRQFLWAWSLRLPGMRRFLKFPDVNGTWIGWRTSSYLESEAKAAEAPLRFRE